MKDQEAKKQEVYTDLEVSLRNQFPGRKGILAQVDTELEIAQDRFDMAIDQLKRQPMTFSSPEAMKSVGVKFDDDKCPYHLVPAFALEGTAWQFKYGAAKYDDWNHSKGMPWSKQARAAIGHIEEIRKGNLDDPETGIGHVYAAIASLMMLAENMVMYPEHNDLYPEAYETKRYRLKDHSELTKVNMLESIKKMKAKNGK